MKLKIFSLCAIGILGVLLVFYTRGARFTVENQQQINKNPSQEILLPKEIPTKESQKINVLEPTNEESTSSVPIGTVPFVVQAPTGNWKDPRFQNGCEEASILMAFAWASGKVYTSQEAEREIKNISAFEEKTIGSAVDTSVQDTADILRKYFQHDAVFVKTDITQKDIEQELFAGHLVLVPAFGRALHNPNFTQPGPITHMLVLTAYDSSKNVFVANDPGTRSGKGYVYDAKTLMYAIWAYETGSEHPAIPDLSHAEKAMIVVMRK